MILPATSVLVIREPGVSLPRIIKALSFLRYYHSAQISKRRSCVHHSDNKTDRNFVSQNDFAALLPPPPSDLGLDAASVSGQQSILGQDATENELFQIQQVQGICHVICFSERHDLTVAEMSDDEILNIINTWLVLFFPFFNSVDILAN